MASLFSPCSHADKAAQSYDAVISGALVYDGSGENPVISDIALKNGRIAGIGRFHPDETSLWINADGLWAIPGLIDAHTHSDFNPLIYPDLPNKVTQGVTTEITGNCGMSAAPIEGNHVEKIHSLWAREGVVLPGELPWNTAGEYRRVLEERGLMTNMALLIGHGNLRSAVMGFEERPASPDELRHMKQLLEASLRDGAAGISFGLVYLPGIFANEEEIAALCAAAAEYGGVCAFHLRSEGSGLVEAVTEAVRIGEKTGAKIQISHMKAAGPANWPKIEEVFKIVEDAQKRGVRVRADAYPYAAGFAELGVVLPDRLFKRPDRVELFKSPGEREQLAAQLEEHFKQKPRSWSAVRIASVTAGAHKKFQGLTIEEIARKTSKTEVETLIDLLAASSFEVSAFYFSQNPEVVEKVINKPYVFAGSDSIADGIEVPHPRAFGTFSLLLKKGVEEGSAAFSALIRRLTQEAAAHFGLEGRGSIRTGYYADIVLINPPAVSDGATYEEPSRLSEGIEWVFINGRPVVEKGRYNSVKAGRFIGPKQG